MKKGFTLIELLTVIVILAIILSIAVPSIINIVEDAQMAAYTNDENEMVAATRTYLSLNHHVASLEVGEYMMIDFADLKAKGLISDIKDPKDSNTLCTGKVFILNSTKGYKYYPSLKCGSNYSTSTDFALKYDAVTSISDVYNSGANNYTITINLNRKGNARQLITPTSTINIEKPTIIDYSTWVLNTTGSQGSFGINGTASENQIILKTNPWGVEDTTWATLTNDTASDADGGWVNFNKSIDKTKKYRLTVWIRREDTGNGRTYFGTQGSNVANLSDGLVNGNPYFRNNVISDFPSMANNWLLWVGYIFPYTYTGASDTTSGVYNLTGNLLTSNTDFKWLSTSTVGGHRVYLYYSTSTTEKQYLYRPRMEIVDGSEPSISELLKGYENGNVYSSTNQVNTSGTVTYTVSTKGKYEFNILVDDNIYKIIYTVD